MILRDIEELTYQEIVDILRIPIGTVKSRINRGRIELAKILRRMNGKIAIDDIFWHLTAENLGNISERTRQEIAAAERGMFT